VTFADTHSEYLWLRAQLGYEPGGIVKEVWDGCDAESQQNMLEQFRAPLRAIQAREAVYAKIRQGDAW
jgi:hypothetical protein